MKNIIAICIIAIVISCNNTTPQHNQDKAQLLTTKDTAINNIKWMLGTWEQVKNDSQRISFEQWEIVNDTEWQGVSYYIESSDTVTQENITILKENDDWLLRVKMPNESAATAFKIITMTATELVCVNDTIAFPNKIRYWVTPNGMSAAVSNADTTLNFEFRKPTNNESLP